MWEAGMPRYELGKARSKAGSGKIFALQATPAYQAFLIEARRVHSSILKGFARELRNGSGSVEDLPPIVPGIYEVLLEPVCHERYRPILGNEPFDEVCTPGQMGSTPLPMLAQQHPSLHLPPVLADYTESDVVHLCREVMRWQIEEVLELRELERTLAARDPNYRSINNS